jgi:hypothetical protein
MSADQPFRLHSRNIVKSQRDGLLIPADILFESVRGEDESAAISKAIRPHSSGCVTASSLQLRRSRDLSQSAVKRTKRQRSRLARKA